MNDKERTLRSYLNAYNAQAYQAINQGMNNLLNAMGYAGGPPRCDFCGRELHEGQQYRHPTCHQLSRINFGQRL